MRIIYLLLKTVEFLHENSVCHRDIHPGNVLLNKELNEIKLIDYGVSKINQNKEIFTPVGVLSRRAPEMRKEEIYSNSVDIWGCGRILFEILTGKFLKTSE